MAGRWTVVNSRWMKPDLASRVTAIEIDVTVADGRAGDVFCTLRNQIGSLNRVAFLLDAATVIDPRRVP
jgi:hypothetical protein